MLRALILLLLTVPVAGRAAPVPREAQKRVLYFPTTVGCKWVYDLNGTDWVQQITAVDEKDGKAVVTVGLVNGERVIPYSKYLVSDKGIFYGLDDLQETKFPKAFLKLPAKPGDEWIEDGIENGHKVIRKIGIAEDIEVPAGKFRAIKVESEVHVGKEVTRKSTGWLAPEIGWVKSVSRFGNEESTKVLKSFTPGKK